MDITYLRYFKVVAEEEHMTRAAEKINITQPALSVIIRHLEDELGFHLFDRKGRQIVLNEYGQIFLKHVKVLLDEYDASLDEMQTMHHHSEQAISLGITGTQFTSKIITYLLNTYPKVQLSQLLLRDDEISEALKKETIDIVLSCLPSTDSDIDCYSLFREPVYLAVSASHPLAGKKAIHLAEAKEEAFVMRQKGFAFRKLSEDLCHASGFTPNIVFESYPDHLLEFVRLGKGVYLVAEAYTQLTSPSGICFLPVIDDFAYREVFLLLLKNKKMSKTHQLIKNAILDYQPCP